MYPQFLDKCLPGDNPHAGIRTTKSQQRCIIRGQHLRATIQNTGQIYGVVQTRCRAWTAWLICLRTSRSAVTDIGTGGCSCNAANKS